VCVRLAAHLQGLTCQISYLADLGETRRFHSESAISLLQNHAETIAGRRLDDAHYAMDYPRPEYADDYAQHFHSPVSFGHEQCRITLPRDWLEEPSPYYHAEIWQQGQIVLAQRIRERRQQAEGGYAEHIRALLRSHQPPLPGLGEVAASLHLSERTLNRRLRDEGTTFRELRAGVMHAWAKLYLGESGLSVEAIAAELDYQDVANFRRAFRQREGCSPATWRSAKR
jgi:AraC-like DNA-binding protein